MFTSISCPFRDNKTCYFDGYNFRPKVFTLWKLTNMSNKRLTSTQFANTF